ncbi:APC membrane recruitment protein 1-like [Myripristis murdjan]|uniref:APC membrane recruitment protein 1 n=1 Tax=Myripristis murdjan TaxID=586833 RepID=A0A667YEU2_9TELE|nr:APC membrane recruitment protein 1-like [Myripristis murdjan]
MASCKVDELASDTKHSASVSEQLSICGPDDTAEEQADTVNATVKPQTPGKFRRTALRFFGVRKSICILPTFFGGRSKNQNKWSSKKGISKSKTHDGISNAGHDESLGREFASAGSFEYHSQKDAARKLHSSSQSECSHPIADQKSVSLTRQKKGLRSLFHSIKHHRNHRNVGLEKNEMIAMSSPLCTKEVPVVQDNANQYVTECLGSLSEPDVPDFANVASDISIAPECSDIDVKVLEKSAVSQGSPQALRDDQMFNNQMAGMKMMSAASSEYEERSGAHSESCLKLQMTPEPVMKSEMPTGSSDQLNLIFGDVSSLKSFDSLTGCGDIIADQDDDSIAESTVSGERSRNGGKRTSCYLTYQGGGEEMASPDDLDEDSLHDFWGNKTSEEICCTCNTEHTMDLSSSHHMDLLNSNSTQQAGTTDTSASIADVLTPQSEHQESVPNSDEGYYDSVTPGPDEGQEKIDRLSADRLPRDSYSGDALYELFAPDESLISPHYDNQSKLPNSGPCEYLSEPVDVADPAFVPEINRLQIGAELYKVHQEFLSPEIPGICSKSKELAPFTIGLHDKGLNESSNLNSKPQLPVNKNNIQAEVFDEKGNILASMEKRTKSLNADCEKRHGNIPFVSKSDPDFDSFSSDTFCEPKEQHLEDNKPVALPYRNLNSCTVSPDVDDGQTVCFSQALVDYTKHSQLLSNTHRNVDGLETNSSFAQNMQALPTIVTFDVVDMHNEGEYDEQIHMEMEEDITSPYQEFEESYLQKDAFAECDYQMLDMYEQNLFSNTWAIASLPRHLSLTRVSQSMPSPLSLDRRSRSLDTESLELKMPDKYRGNRAAIVSCPRTEKDSKRESSLYYKKNVLVSTSEVRDSSSIMSLSWQTKSEMALSLPLTDKEITDKVQSLHQTQVKHKIFSSASSSDFANTKLQLLSSDVSERVSCDFISQNTEICNRQCHLPLRSNSGLPHSTFVFSGFMGEDLLVRTVPASDGDEDIFYKTAIGSESYNQCSKSRSPAITQGMSHAGSPLNTGATDDDMDFISEARKARDLPRPVACNKLPEATLN